MQPAQPAPPAPPTQPPPKQLLGGTLLWAAGAPPPEDALWLAASVPLLPKGARVLDAGCGAGAVGLALLARQPQLLLTGVDIDPHTLPHARANAAANGRLATFMAADILTPLTTVGGLFTAIVCNPPFHPRSAGHHSPVARKNLAHGLPNHGLAPWLAALAAQLAPQGWVYWVLHSQLLPSLLATAAPYGGVLHTALLASHTTRPPKRLLAAWQPNNHMIFQHITAPMVLTYHSPVRQAVLHAGGPLVAWPSLC